MIERVRHTSVEWKCQQSSFLFRKKGAWAWYLDVKSLFMHLMLNLFRGFSKIVQKWSLWAEYLVSFCSYSIESLLPGLELSTSRKLIYWLKSRETLAGSCTFVRSINTDDTMTPKVSSLTLRQQNVVSYLIFQIL